MLIARWTGEFGFFFVTLVERIGEGFDISFYDRNKRIHTQHHPYRYLPTREEAVAWGREKAQEQFCIDKTEVFA